MQIKNERRDIIEEFSWKNKQHVGLLANNLSTSYMSIKPYREVVSVSRKYGKITYGLTWANNYVKDEIERNLNKIHEGNEYIILVGPAYNETTFFGSALMSRQKFDWNTMSVYSFEPRPQTSVYKNGYMQDLYRLLFIDYQEGKTLYRKVLRTDVNDFVELAFKIGFTNFTTKQPIKSYRMARLYTELIGLESGYPINAPTEFIENIDKFISSDEKYLYLPPKLEKFMEEYLKVTDKTSVYFSDFLQAPEEFVQDILNRKIKFVDDKDYGLIQTFLNTSHNLMIQVLDDKRVEMQKEIDACVPRSIINCVIVGEKYKFNTGVYCQC